MKRKHIMLLFVPLLLYGCSPTNSDSAANVTTLEEATTTEPSAETQPETMTSENRKELSNETHLEMVDFYDYCPVYSFTVKKIEGSTGNELSFDSTQALIEPEGQIGGLMTSVDTTIYDAADPKTLSFLFWNKTAVDSLKFTIDDLEYNIQMPKAESYEIEINKDISYKDYTFTIKSATVYPKAIALQITGISNYKLFENNFILNVDDERYPPFEFWEDDLGRMLLYAFEEDIAAEKVQSIDVGVISDYKRTDISLK